MSRSLSIVVGMLALAAILLASCNCPPRPEPSTSGGGNTYGKSERRMRNIDRGWNPPPAARLDKLEVDGDSSAGAEPEEAQPIDPLPEGMAAARPPFVPRGGNVRNGGLKSSDTPVRVQIGPRPVVLESGRLDDGDELVLVVIDAESEEVVYEREFAIVRTAARTDVQPDITISPDDWEPEPGRYIIEIRRDDLIVGVEELTVSD